MKGEVLYGTLIFAEMSGQRLCGGRRADVKIPQQKLYGTYLGTVKQNCCPDGAAVVVKSGICNLVRVCLRRSTGNVPELPLVWEVYLPYTLRR